MKFYFFDRNDAFINTRTDPARFIVYERDMAFEATFPPRDDFPLLTGQRIGWQNDDGEWEIYEIDKVEMDAFGGGVFISGVHLCVAELRDWIRTSFSVSGGTIAAALDNALSGTQWRRGTVDGDSGQTSTVEQYRVTGNAVYLRSKPTSNSTAITAYKKNTIVTLIQKTNSNWYKVQGPDGRAGYMSTAYLAYSGTGSGAASGTVTIEEQRWQTVWHDVELTAQTAKKLLIPSVEIPGNGAAWIRTVNLVTTEPEYNGVRLSCNTNVQDGAIIYDSAMQYTRMYGLGKNELDFSSVVWTVAGGKPVDKPAGQGYVELPPDEAAQITRGGNPRVGLVFFDDETDAANLLQRTWEQLDKLKTPQITMNSVIADLYKMGYGGQAMRMYDAVQLILEPINVRIMARVIDLQRDRVNPENTRPIIGTQLGADILDNISITSNLR